MSRWKKRKVFCLVCLTKRILRIWVMEGTHNYPLANIYDGKSWLWRLALSLHRDKVPLWHNLILSDFSWKTVVLWLKMVPEWPRLCEGKYVWTGWPLQDALCRIPVAEICLKMDSWLVKSSIPAGSWPAGCWTMFSRCRGEHSIMKWCDRHGE